mmetsp:Transcript_43389/g.50194  ORF Transcript_43389/g.50194 Transcript_43389/m.50194 type:complete len:215 (+) Transcript_43389:55-699(+)
MEFMLLMFTLGYLCQLVGSGILIRKIQRKKNTEGLSFETQICYLIGSIVRVVWVSKTRLSKYWLVWIELAVSIGVAGYMVYLFYKNKDTLQIKNPIKLPYIMIACGILSYFFHPGKRDAYMQMLVSFTIFLEAAGMLPQIYILRKLKTVEVTIGNYVVLLALSRVFRLAFWIISYYDGVAFGYLIIADLIHTLLLADFVYFYLRTKPGTPILLQ